MCCCIGVNGERDENGLENRRLETTVLVNLFFCSRGSTVVAFVIEAADAATARAPIANLDCGGDGQIRHELQKWRHCRSQLRTEGSEVIRRGREPLIGAGYKRRKGGMCLLILLMFGRSVSRSRFRFGYWLVPFPVWFVWWSAYSESLTSALRDQEHGATAEHPTNVNSRSSSFLFCSCCFHRL